MSFEYVAARLQGERDALQAEVERNAATLTTYKAEARGALALRDQYADQVAALQARIDALESSAFESAGFTRGTERAAIIPLMNDGQAMYIYDPHNEQLQNQPTHERVVWRGPWEPEPRCPGCRQRLRDLRAANDNHTDCSAAAAVGVDPQKEEQA